ncbi:hypothetical protein [Hymenobacter psychrophilus]|uniref:Translation initiation factor IF-2 n=1 Tax=Hymenobacter psychrophilus TaxID=651662 RepID=A0A1H3HM96_9BACT|nr:hypothetical protein [Hymenobacter psychrophilus]SDY15914.1 hypothetical protein SAMN04488069_10633 [Hymenobacter psychrophilus]
MTNRQLVPLLLLGGIFLAAPAVAQKKSDGWGDAGDGWGTPAPKKAASAKVTPAKAAKAAPAMATPAPEPVAAASAGSEWGGATGAAGAANSPAYGEQPIGANIAPGFTAAPSRRVTTDYRGRPLAPYVRRSVRSADIAPPVIAAPAPILVPEPEPIAAAPAPMPTAKPASAQAATAAGTKNGGAAAATKKAAPAKKAPAKKADDGWGSGGSGW